MEDQTTSSNHAEPVPFTDLSQYLSYAEQMWIEQKAHQMAEEMCEGDPHLWDYVSIRVEAILNNKKHMQNQRLDSLLAGVDLQRAIVD